MFTLFFSTKYQTQLLKVTISGILTFLIVKNFINFDVETAGFSISTETDNLIFLIAIILIFLLFVVFSKIKWWLVIGIMITTTFLLIGSIFAWNQFLGNYQRERVLTFIEGPEADPLGSGYQIIQSKLSLIHI